jgi:hypothetical protein
LATYKDNKWAVYLTGSILAIFAYRLGGGLFQDGFNIHEWLTKQAISNLFLVVLIAALFYGIHELIHGITIFLVTNKRPIFGFVYAGLPLNKYITKFQFLMVALLPLVAITLICIFTCRLIVLNWVGYLSFAACVNLGASAYDVFLSAWILKQTNATKFGFDGHNTVARHFK